MKAIWMFTLVTLATACRGEANDDAPNGGGAPISLNDCFDFFTDVLERDCADFDPRADGASCDGVYCTTAGIGGSRFDEAECQAFLDGWDDFADCVDTQCEDANWEPDGNTCQAFVFL